MAGSSTERNNPETFFDVKLPNVSFGFKPPAMGAAVGLAERKLKTHGSIGHMAAGNGDICNGFVDGARP
jgi:hypothetical protein